jgi:lipopolysaccharide transport system ATP-binding protein
MSDAVAQTLSIVAEGVWVKYMIRYHRAELTVRAALVGLLSRARRTDGCGAIGRREFWALRDLNLVARPGDVIGIIGRNGSGKTTLLKTLAGICAPDRGRLTVRGRVGCLLSFGVGFKPTLTGRENIYLNGSILGLPRREIERRIDEVIAFSELGEFIDAPVRTYSAGMKGRLGFSIAVHIDPDVLVLDEVLSVGDAAFRAKAGTILERFRADSKTVVLATHSMDLVRRSCTRALWLQKGEVKMLDEPGRVADAYLASTKVAAEEP